MNSIDVYICNSNQKNGDISIICHDDKLDWYKAYFIIGKDGIGSEIDMINCDGIDLENLNLGG